jgi:CheY-like chemotaxis protein
LGLSIARRFVELMGGQIGVSSSIDVGSTFWFEIPLRKVRDPGAIAIVDDARALRLLLADLSGGATGLAAMLASLGLRPQVVESGEQLRRAIHTTAVDARPDVVVTTTHPQDAHVQQAIARLEEQCAPGGLPPVLLIADPAQSTARHKPLLRSQDLVLLRPVTCSSLFNALNSLVARRESGLDRAFLAPNLNDVSAQWLARVHVLVADDSEVNRIVAQRILEHQGARVATCADGNEAVDYVRDHQQQLDIVLMDVHMPVLDGNEATRRIRDELNLRALPIAAMTAGALVTERQRALDAGMNDFVSKPFAPQALIRKVRRLVEEARGQPIAMVSTDRPPDRRSTESRLPASIDAVAVQQMFGEDLGLFKLMLLRILQEYGDLGLTASTPLADPAAVMVLKARLHKLAGSAGMIGAMGVMKLAAAAQRAIEKGGSIAAAKGPMEQLALALVTLQEQSEPLLRGLGEHDEVGSKPPKARAVRA